jgi:hypothetical protein
MDQPQPLSKPLETAGDEWPHGPCRPDQVYVMDTNWTDSVTLTQQRVIIMSESSWTKFGTTMEQMRRQLERQDARIRELLGNAALAQQAKADAEDRLEAHREARRREKRAEIEGDLIVPGDPRFTNQRKKS